MRDDLIITQGLCDFVLSKKGSLGTIKGKSPNLANGGRFWKKRDVFGRRERVLEGLEEEEEED